MNGVGPAGNALLAPAPQAIGVGMSGFGGVTQAATGQPGFGTGAGMFGTLAPVTVRGDLTQPASRAPAWACEPGGAGLPLITTSSRANWQTGYGARLSFRFRPVRRNRGECQPGTAAHCRPPGLDGRPAQPGNLWQLGAALRRNGGNRRRARGRLCRHFPACSDRPGALHSRRHRCTPGQPRTDHRSPTDLPAALEILLVQAGPRGFGASPNASRRTGRAVSPSECRNSAWRLNPKSPLVQEFKRWPAWPETRARSDCGWRAAARGEKHRETPEEGDPCQELSLTAAPAGWRVSFCCLL